jgi:hypothetical protein
LRSSSWNTARQAAQEIEGKRWRKVKLPVNEKPAGGADAAASVGTLAVLERGRLVVSHHRHSVV